MAALTIVGLGAGSAPELPIWRGLRSGNDALSGELPVAVGIRLTLAEAGRQARPFGQLISLLAVACPGLVAAGAWCAVGPAWR